MEKRRKTSRYLKNRTWKSKIGNRLRGRVQEICQDYLYGAIDSLWAGHFKLKEEQGGQK